MTWLALDDDEALTLDDPHGRFWTRVRAAISEGFCPAPGCGRLRPDPRVPADASGGSCPVHGIRWTRQPGTVALGLPHG